MAFQGKFIHCDFSSWHGFTANPPLSSPAVEFVEGLFAGKVEVSQTMAVRGLPILSGQNPSPVTRLLVRAVGA